MSIKVEYIWLVEYSTTSYPYSHNATPHENNVPELSRSNHTDNQDQTGTKLVHYYHEPSSKASNNKIQTCKKGKTYFYDWSTGTDLFYVIHCINV